MRKIGFILSFFLSWSAHAQQDAQFSQYMFNTIYFNPAVAGTDGRIQICGIYRSQWLGYTPTYSDGGPPVTQILSVHSPIQRLHGGIGGFLVNDKLGPLNNIQAQGTYSYHSKIRNSILSFGIQGGIYVQTMNFGLYRANDPADPLLTGKIGKDTQIKPDLAAGIQFKHQKYSVGVGVSHLTMPSFDYGVNADFRLKPHFYIHGSYEYDISFEVKLKFFSLVKFNQNQNIFDVGALAYYKDYLWGGFSFRQSEAIILLLGYSFLKSKALKFGYSLDYVIRDRQAKQATSHEIMLQYSLPINISQKKIIRTPRFRY